MLSAIGVGLSSSRNLSSMPGMNPNSYGIHSDDWNVFRCVNSRLYKKLRVRSHATGPDTGLPKMRANLRPMVSTVFLGATSTIQSGVAWIQFAIAYVSR